MRLLNTEKLEMKEFFDEDIPVYAILSHRWEDDEVSYQDMESGKNKDGAGFRKILKCREQALEDGYEWVWIDTCCIDKKSSAKLSEAINAMFRWYKDAARCYAYLSDVVKGDSIVDSLENSLWFTRGWTLQELIAPVEVYFHDRNWTILGTRTELKNEISRITGIPEMAFRSVSPFSVAQKMSWASDRKTSRREDMAYCLLGLFDLSMPLLYGEGKRAFIRLQEEIIRTIADESIFIWNDSAKKIAEMNHNLADMAKSIQKLHDGGINMLLMENYDTRLLASEVKNFAQSGEVVKCFFFKRPPFAMTHNGLSISTPIFRYDRDDLVSLHLVPLNCFSNRSERPFAMILCCVKNNWFRYGYLAMNTSLGDVNGMVGNKRNWQSIIICRKFGKLISTRSISEVNTYYSAVGLTESP